MLPRETELDAKGSHVAFATTHWSVVAAAGGKGAPNAEAALATLCKAYWRPLYAYIRRRGHCPQDAEDLVQGFLAQLLEHGSIQGVVPDRGRFRSFLLGSLNYFLADQRDRAMAKKRGGGRILVSIDATEAEGRYLLEPADQRSPDQLFERRWAMAVLDRVLLNLEEEYNESGKVEVFQELRRFLLGDKSHGTYGQVATRLGMSEAAVKMAASRLRQRYRQLFREIVAETVADASEVEAELRHLISVLAN